MKIQPQHFDILKTEINLVLKRYPGIVEEYETGNFPRADKTKDLQKRFCFDLFYGAGLCSFACNTLYDYLNDDHIYTALKAICPTVIKRY